MKRPFFFVIQVSPGETQYINIEDISRLILRGEQLEINFQSGGQQTITGPEVPALLKLMKPFIELDESDMPIVGAPWQ